MPIASALCLAVSVQRVVHGELAPHILEVIRADSSEAVSYRFETDTLRRPVFSRRVCCADDPGQLDEGGIVVEAIAGDYRIERTVFAVVS